MSPASRSKSKEKSSTKTSKEQKTPSKLIAGNAAAGTQANAYNPASGTFHMLETISVMSSASPNGRFRTIDETDDHSGSSLGTAAEYDSVSNNDSWSGESEDQKDKISGPLRQEPPPGAASTGNEKRDKIRQKNERKHQRQKERRAQELHDRCIDYLMSWKLECLSQQLVAMGFSSDRATMALIINEGRVEESVAWLFEAGEEAQASEAKVGTRGNLKIDITEELARMADMEVRFKSTRQEVERAVVACEGDLEKASEVLRSQKQEANPSKPEKPIDLSSNSSTKPAAAMSTVLKSQTVVKAVAAPSIRQRRDQRDFNYSKTVEDTNSRHLVALRRSQGKTEWARAQLPPATDKNSWPTASASASAPALYSMATAMPGMPLAPKVMLSEAMGVAGGNEGRSGVQSVSIKEPIVVMQRPQSANFKQQTATSSGSASATIGWNAKGIIHVEQIKSLSGSHGPGHTLATSASTSTVGTEYHPQGQYQPFMPSPVDSIAPSWSADTSISRGFGGAVDPPVSAGGGWSLSGASLSVPSSLGLYTGWSSSQLSGSTLAASAAAWSKGRTIVECDYRNIDWSLTPSSSISRPDQSKQGFASLSSSGRAYESWSATTGAKVGVDVGGLFMSGLQGAGGATEATSISPDWTSPFAGKDMFSLPRKFVTSPSL